MKLLKELLKDAETIEKRGGVSRFKLTTGNGGQFYDCGLTDGHFIKFYNSKRFYIDPEKIEGVMPVSGPYKLETITAGVNSAELVKLTNNTRIIPCGRKNATVRELKFNDGGSVWYDINFEAYFDDGNRRWADLEFRAANKKAPIYLLYNSELVGVVLPVCVND